MFSNPRGRVYTCFSACFSTLFIDIFPLSLSYALRFLLLAGNQTPRSLGNSYAAFILISSHVLNVIHNNFLWHVSMQEYRPYLFCYISGKHAYVDRSARSTLIRHVFYWPATDLEQENCLLYRNVLCALRCADSVIEETHTLNPPTFPSYILTFVLYGVSYNYIFVCPPFFWGEGGRGGVAIFRKLRLNTSAISLPLLSTLSIYW